MSDMDRVWVDGEVVGDLLLEVKRLRAENESLRAQVPVWTTVTEDPATLPEYYRDVLCVSMGKNFTAFRDDEMWAVPHIVGKLKRVRLERCTMTPIQPGDRWTYVPKVPA